jgi:hypothetical protein
MRSFGAFRTNFARCLDFGSLSRKPRLWGLDAVSCSALLDALIEAEFLFRTRDGAFMRVERTALARARLRAREKTVAA